MAEDVYHPVSEQSYRIYYISYVSPGTVLNYGGEV